MLALIRFQAEHQRELPAPGTEAPPPSTIGHGAGNRWSSSQFPCRTPATFEVWLDFALQRPRSHFGTGRNAKLLRERAWRWPIGKPDVDNLTKAVLDALTRFDDLPPLIWCDDAQVVSVHALKRYADPPRKEGLQISVCQVGFAP